MTAIRVPGAVAGRRSGRRAIDALPLVVVVAAVSSVVAIGLSTPGFFSVSNLKAVLLSASIVGILAVGETLIMIGGRLFSLSLATSAAVAALGCVEALRFGLPAAFLVAVGLGVAMNGVQGGVIGRYDANPVIVTIAAGGLMTGLGASLTGNHELIPTAHASELYSLARPLLGIPISVYLFLGFALLGELALRRTRWGRQLFMAGDSLPAARAAGLPVTALTVTAFSLAGLGAGVAGVLLAATNGDASLSLAGNDTYAAITAALVGGTLVTGGQGSVTRTVLGAVGVAAIADLVLLRGYSAGVQILVEGGLVFVAIVVVRLVRR